MKRAHRKAPWLLLGLLGWALGASAAEVTVQQVDSLGNTLAEAAYVSTDEVFTSVSAPTQAGYRFAYWTISPALATFANRDGWGRALDAVSFIPKDSETTLTAVYLPTSQDDDGDGMADGEELYWYDSLDYGPESDTDGDGYTFAQELQFGLNPLFPDGLTLGASPGAIARSGSTTRTNMPPTPCAPSRRASSSPRRSATSRPAPK